MMTGTQLWRVILSLGVCSQLSAARQFVPLFARDSRSLRDSFPFNLGEHGEHGARHGEDNTADVTDFFRDERQGSESASSIPFSDVASSYAQGKRCIDKVFMEERTEYDQEITCQHSYDKRCAKSLVTVYNSQQEEECEENYVKNCFIEYSKYAANVTNKVCRTPLVKDCESSSGPEICRTEYESECTTSQEVHDVEDDVVECRTEVEEKCEDETSGYTTNTKCSKWPREVCSVSKKQVKKFTPQTRCEKVPVELCGPAGCGVKPGPEECQDRVQTVVGDNPEENCSLDPQTTCKHVTKLVPSLKQVENCFDVPKEVCVRSEVNPRVVKVPVVKKWCYVVACPDECVEAAKEGLCPANCKEHEGNSRCCAPCSLECQAAAQDGQCPASCRQYEGINPTCCGGCPQKCKDAARREVTEPSCKQFRRDPECYFEPTQNPPKDPCPATCRQNPDQSQCARYEDIPGCYPRPPPPVPVCEGPNGENLYQCEEAAKRGVCLNECYTLFYNDNSARTDCCPTCPELCKQQARQETTYKNGTLDCGSFTRDKECFFEGCPSKCKTSYQRGERNDDCEQYSNFPECFRKCPKTCEDSFSRGERNEACQKYSSVPNCFVPCPVKCKESFEKGERNDECEKYKDIPKCFKPCPEKCEQSFKDKITNPSCERFAASPFVPMCYYTPCSQECMDQAANNKCPGQCSRFKGNPACCAEECPANCMEAAQKGQCASGCEKYRGNPRCCIVQGSCDADCQEKSFWGECPARCKQFEGDPDCCAPTCPAKCSNRRRSECGAGGVEECDGIPGCCPEHFDVVFGAGAYFESAPRGPVGGE